MVRTQEKDGKKLKKSKRSKVLKSGQKYWLNMKFLSKNKNKKNDLTKLKIWNLTRKSARLHEKRGGGIIL